MEALDFQKEVEKWGMLEVKCKGPSDKNPFTDYRIEGTFTGKNETVTETDFMMEMGFIKYALCHPLRDAINL